MRLRIRSTLIAAGVVVLLAAGYFVANRLSPRIDDRIYRIGWQHVPPFQHKADDGSPAGLAVDLIHDAARRRGIRLQWVWYPESSEAALRKREVDLWPLITITPQRQREKAIYISKPYLQHDHNLLVLASSKYSQPHDLAFAPIGHLPQPINVQLLHSVLPQSRLVAATSEKELFDNVCRGQTDAIFLDEFTAGAVLLSGVACPSRPLRVIPLPSLRSNL